MKSNPVAKELPTPEELAELKRDIEREQNRFARMVGTYLYQCLLYRQRKESHD